MKHLRYALSYYSALSRNPTTYYIRKN